MSLHYTKEEHKSLTRAELANWSWLLMRRPSLSVRFWKHLQNWRLDLLAKEWLTVSDCTRPRQTTYQTNRQRKSGVALLYCGMLLACMHWCDHKCDSHSKKLLLVSPAFSRRIFVPKLLSVNTCGTSKMLPFSISFRSAWASLRKSVFTNPIDSLTFVMRDREYVPAEKGQKKCQA